MGGMTGVLGQNGHPGSTLPRSRWRDALAGGAGLLALALLASVALSACGTDVAKAATFLTDPRATTVALADGSVSTPTERTRVPSGATVTTAPGGSASLTSVGRVVLLGSDSSVTVLDGSREELRRGLVMVDARRTGSLTLSAGAADVSTPRGSLVRVERGVLLRVASFRGDADVRSTGRKAAATVTALHQVQVPYGGLPGRVTALALTRDSWERRYAQGLVSADVDLNALADSLDRDVASRVAVGVPASFTSVGPASAPLPAGDAALAYLVAQAAPGGDRTTYATVRQLRDEGGSWGVVAALVGAGVPSVSKALDQAVAPVEGVLALDGVTGVGPDGSPVGGPGGPGPNPSPGGPGVPATPSPTPTRTAPPPSSPPGPAGPVTDALQSVVNAVVSALPAPVATLVPRPKSNVQDTAPGLPPLVDAVTAPLLGTP